MLQRIQTIYWFLAFVLNILFFFLPIGEVKNAENEVYTAFYRGMETSGGELIFAAYPVAILFTVVAVLLCVTIFIYKKRTLQMRFSIFNMLLLVGGIGLMYFYGFVAFEEIENAETSFGIAATFPLIEIIFIYLGFKGVQKDALMLLAADRIR